MTAASCGCASSARSSARGASCWPPTRWTRTRPWRFLPRIYGGGGLGLGEFGTEQGAWGKLRATDGVEEDEAVATLGREAWPAPPLDQFAELIDQPRHLHPLLRDQRTIAGIGR